MASLFAATPERDARLSKSLVGPLDKSGFENVPYPLDLAKYGITLPATDDPKLDRALRDKRTIFYKLSQTWQHWIPANRVEHKNLTFGTSTYTTTPPIWGVFDTKYLADFNANPDFPWEVTVGLNLTHRAKSLLYGTVNFMALPTDEDGIQIPVLLLVDERPVKWLYPPGTMLAEMIFVNHEGRRYIQEIRTRVKSEDNKKWFPGVYRPVRDRDEFMRLTGLRYEPGKRYMNFRNPEEDEVFAISGTVERLPNVDEAITKALLSRPFVDVTNSNWSPAPDQDFSILPKDYSFGLMTKVDSTTCGGCHRQTQISVRSLIPHEPNIIQNPTKVGNIRGCDGIFTWHPFDTRSVRPDASVEMGPVVYTRAFDARNGVVKVVHSGQAAAAGGTHPYQLTKYCQEALAKYELPAPAFLHATGEVKPETNFFDPPEDGLSPQDRQLLIARSRVQPAPEPGSEASLRWDYRGNLDPTKFFRGVLRDADGKVVGVYDPSVGSFRSWVNETLGPPSQSPIPIPKEVREQK
jgi:hypothetical protein